MCRKLCKCGAFNTMSQHHKAGNGKSQKTYCWPQQNESLTNGKQTATLNRSDSNPYSRESVVLERLIKVMSQAGTIITECLDEGAIAHVFYMKADQHLNPHPRVGCLKQITLPLTWHCYCCFLSHFVATHTVEYTHTHTQTLLWFTLNYFIWNSCSAHIYGPFNVKLCL